MTRLAFALVLPLLVGCGATSNKPAEPRDLKGDAKAKADQMIQAFIKAGAEKDCAAVVDFLHPKVIELRGGREKAIADLHDGAKSRRERKNEYRSAQVGDSFDLVTKGDVTYVVVPVTLEMDSPPIGSILTKYYVIGVSPDSGKTWTFVWDDDVKAALPNLPADLKVPEGEFSVLKRAE